MNHGIKSLLLAVLTTGGVLAGTYVSAAQLQRSARRNSHQQPTEDRWEEPTTVTSPALVGRGRTLFVHSCAHCHGFDASGDEGPDLHDAQVSDRYMANLILRGMPHEMPSFAKKFSHDDVVALVAYVRSLEATRR